MKRNARVSHARAVFAALAVTLTAPPRAHAQTPPQEPFILVTGVGEARVPSDRARLDFMVETQAPTAQAASTQNAARMDRVIKALRASGGTTVTIETGGYSLSPVYREPGRDQGAAPTIEAYRAVNHVHVQIGRAHV